MKIPKKVQEVAIHMAIRTIMNTFMRTLAKKVGFQLHEEDDDEESSIGIGKKISALVALSGGVFWLGKMIADLRTTVGTNWNVLVDLTEQHQKLKTQIDDLAHKLNEINDALARKIDDVNEENVANDRELSELWQRVETLGKHVDQLTAADANKTKEDT